MLDEMYELYKDKGITKIVGVESRGFVMAAALAARLGCGVVLARKPGKLPATVIKESFSKEYGVDTVEMHIDSINPDDVVLIGFTDDVHAAYVTPRMSAIEDQSYEMGVKACQLLLKSINGDQKVYKEIVPQKLVIRDTSAKHPIPCEK